LEVSIRNFLAALLAIACWAGLAIQFSATYGHEHQVVGTLWILARFFTVLTNLLVAAAMTWVAIGNRISPLVLGGLTLAILLVGVVYGLLLHGLHPLRGPASLANILLHMVSPALMAFWWLLFAPRARLKWNAPWLWSVYPLAYLAYVLARGRTDGRYPYPFIDLPKIGWTQAAMNVGGIALGFILWGFLLVWVDSWRPLGSKKANG
jgi:hypothetical protein